MTKNSKKMHILDHLEELRWTIIKILICMVPALIVGTLTLKFFQGLIIDTVPEGIKLRNSSPMEVVVVQFKMAIYLALIFTFPVTFYFIWNFIAPGLRKKERTIIIFMVFVASILFAAGVYLAYIATPFVVKAIIGYSPLGVENFWDYAKYISFLLSMILAFGIVFELPLIVSMLVKMQFIKVATLKKNRKYALLIGAFFSAVMTPPDAISMVILLLPLLILYEIGVICGYFIEKKLAKKLKLTQSIEEKENKILKEIEVQNNQTEQLISIEHANEIDSHDENEIDYFTEHDSDAGYEDFYNENDDFYNTVYADDIDDNYDEFIVPKQLKKGSMELEKLPDIFNKNIFKDKNDKGFFD
ncbi:twin-arginine translocase subunit TatC [Lentisphaerota bacterium WC36G]|nr:twin-arginine translocase subunit TatC [Lentisphaerae bacterium WC36]